MRHERLTVGVIADTCGLLRPGAAAVLDGAGPHRLYVLHALASLDIDPAAAGFSAAISGHSHQPSAERRDGVLFLDPGSAGPRLEPPIGIRSQSAARMLRAVSMYPA